MSTVPEQREGHICTMRNAFEAAEGQLLMFLESWHRPAREPKVWQDATTEETRLLLDGLPPGGYHDKE